MEIQTGGSPGGGGRPLQVTGPEPTAPRAAPMSPQAQLSPQTRQPTASALRQDARGGDAAAGGECGEERVIVTAVGRNRPGVLGELATLVGRERGDIQEVSQRVHEGFFTLVFVVDISACTGSTLSFKQALESLSRGEELKILVQHQRVFEAMHRV